MPAAVLFRTPRPPDPYDLIADHYTTICVPVLTETLSPAALIPHLAQPYDAVVMTSRRAAETWTEAVRASGADTRDWSLTPLFSPGDASRNVLRHLPPNLRPNLAAHPPASSAAALLPHILQLSSLTQSSKWTSLSVLVLTGDKTLRELPDGLLRAGHRVTEVDVYATTVRPDMAASVLDCRARLAKSGSMGEGIAAGDGGGPVWAVFFSPSSAAGVVLHLSAWPQVRIAAIGETTASWLRAHGLTVDAVAEEPSAQGLLAALLKADDMR